MTASKFIAHLVNQMILHEIVALELLTLLLEEPTDDSVEVAVGFLKVKITLIIYQLWFVLNLQAQSAVVINMCTFTSGDAISFSETSYIYMVFIHA